MSLQGREKFLFAVAAAAIALALFLAYRRTRLPVHATGVEPKMEQPSLKAAPSGNPKRTSIRHQSAFTSPAGVPNPKTQEVPGSKPRLSPDAVPLAEIYGALAKAADAGDATSAMRLYLDIGACTDAKKQLGKFAESDAWPKVGSRLWPTLTQENFELAANLALKQSEAAEDSAKLCDGLSQEQLSSRDTWLKIAANNGNTQAQLIYYLTEIPGGGDIQIAMQDLDALAAYKQNSLDYLNDAASQCVPEAWSFLANEYQNGGIVSPNPVYAQAYRLTIHMHTSQSGTASINVGGNSLTQQENDEALKMALKMVNSFCN